MTVFGKVFVLIITALSLVLLGISTVVFTTRPDWKQQIAALKKEIGEAEVRLNAAKASEAEEKAKLTDTQAQADQPKKYYEPRIAGLKSDEQRAQTEIAAARTAFAEAQAALKTNGEEVGARTGQIVILRTQVDAVTDQSKRFAQRQAEIKDDIVQTRRLLDAAATNADQIRKTQ